jgi:hypothetical protein
MILSISGCKKAEENNVPSNNNTTIPTLTPTPKPTGTVTPALELSPAPAATATPLPTPAQNEETSTSKIDESWIKAYYDYIVDNESQYDPYLLLIDLNFDGVPELFDIFIAGGSQAYQKGITYTDGKVMTINNDKMNVSAFVGTMSNVKEEKVWYTRYYPLGFHNSTGSEIDINSYNCSDLFDITGADLFQIGFANTNSDEPDVSSVNVSILKDGKSVNVASSDKQSMINWYLNDNNSDFGSDWYNNQRLTAEELNSLLPLAQFESELNIQEQKSANVNLSKCYTTTGGENSLDYKLFYNEVIGWYNENQIKQWEFFK